MSPPERLLKTDISALRMPRYVQVASILRHRIEDGTWRVGDQLPTIEALEHEFAVARVTVRQAIEVLREEGLLQSQQGKGTFLIKTIERDRWLNLGTDWRSLLAPIANNVPHPLPAKSPSPPEIHPDEGQAAEHYVFLHTLQTRDGEPYALARVHVARSVYDKAPAAFRKQVALAVLSSLKDVKIDRARQTLEIASADPDTARHLNIALDAPIAKARVVVTGRGNVVLYVGEIIYRGDCLRISIELTDARR